MAIQLLIVDDDEPFRRVLIKELSRRGFAVDGAADGMEAMGHIEKHAYHLVLLDLQMPGMDGMEVLTQLKRNVPSTEAIMMTAYPTPEDAEEAIRRGAFHYLMKPTPLDEIEILLRRAYKKSRLEAQNLMKREQIERGMPLPEFTVIRNF